MYESASISVFLQHGCLSRWFWGWRWWRFLYGCMSCLDMTKYRCLHCKFPLCSKCSLQKKTMKFQVGKLESLLHIVCLARKKPSSKVHSTQHMLLLSKGFIFTVSFMEERALFWACRCLLYMHESSLLTYLHIPSVFHNQHPCNGYRELYSRRNIDVTLTNHCPTWPLFYFFGVAARFDWIKIDVWPKLGVLNYSSRPKLSLGSARVKYSIWPGPKSKDAWLWKAIQDKSGRDYF